MREETGKQFFILESTDDSEVCVFGAGGGATGLSHITLACSHEHETFCPHPSSIQYLLSFSLVRLCCDWG